MATKKTVHVHKFSCWRDFASSLYILQYIFFLEGFEKRLSFVFSAIFVYFLFLFISVAGNSGKFREIQKNSGKFRRIQEYSENIGELP